MDDKFIIYCKQIGEPSVPVTIRVEWRPDGTIRPLLYWTPDGSCYQVIHIYETTPLALLKDRGEGLRFRVKSEVIETIEPYSDFRFTRHEAYLYFADGRFCEKNIIDGRYGHKGKEYIPVTLDVFSNSDYELVYFMVQGSRYMVEKTIAVEPRGSYSAGGVGVWHHVEARRVNADNDDDPAPDKSVRRHAAIYFEINKWFTTIKTHDKPCSIL